MATLEYPSDLPTPQELPTESAERRVLSPSGGLFEARAGQTDLLDYEDYLFTLSPARALAFDYFWRETLSKGGKWFSASWPRPEGVFPTARRFIDTPHWDFIPIGREQGYWRVTGSFEVRGAGEPPADSSSAWNPLDMLTATPPVPLVLTENNRLATRATRVDSYEGGVRGTMSHSGTGKWYFELQLVSIGNGAVDAVDNQNMAFGILDGSMLNQLAYPLNVNSNPDVTSTFVVCSTRFDGIVWSSYATYNASPGTFSTQPDVGDIFGFAWEVGVNLKIYRNGTLGVTATLPTVAAMYPYFNAGETNANGAVNDTSEESVRIRTGSRQFAYSPPTGYFPWG